METVILNNEDVEYDPKGDFFIDEANIDGELCRSGRLLSFYGQLAAELKAHSASRKADLEMFDAELAIGIRAEGKKVTEGGIKERVITDETRKKVQGVYIKSERDFQKIENLYRSMQKKVDCVIALCYKQRTEIAKSAY